MQFFLQLCLEIFPCYIQSSTHLSFFRGPFLATSFVFCTGGFSQGVVCPEMPLVLGPKVCPRALSIFLRVLIVFGFLCERSESLQGYWVLVRDCGFGSSLFSKKERELWFCPPLFCLPFLSPHLFFSSLFSLLGGRPGFLAPLLCCCRQDLDERSGVAQHMRVPLCPLFFSLSARAGCRSPSSSCVFLFLFVFLPLSLSICFFFPLSLSLSLYVCSSLSLSLSLSFPLF